MHQFWLLVTLLLLVSMATGQDVVTNPRNKCHYCGITNNCPLPYDVEDEDNKFIMCDKSCLKFDGFAMDGKRVLVRTCGYFVSDECVDGQFFEDSGTVGNICHCLEDKCNLATKITSMFLSTVTALILYLIVY
jgi:hypothetical protein